jgi:hypothetical protein
MKKAINFGENPRKIEQASAKSRFSDFAALHQYISAESGGMHGFRAYDQHKYFAFSCENCWA